MRPETELEKNRKRNNACGSAREPWAVAYVLLLLVLAAVLLWIAR